MNDFFTQQKNIFASTISLIPSENYSFYSDFTKIYTTDISNRYSFYTNPTFSRAFPGHGCIEEIEKNVTQMLEKLFHVKHINLTPLSGMNALSIFLAGVGEIGDSILLVHPKNGGHISSEKIAKRLGYNIIYIPFIDGFNIDYKALRDIIKTHKPRLIYIDQMNGIMPLSLKEIEDLDIIKYYDISHNAAFIIGKQHPNPLKDGYDAFGGSTHKTIPGPQKAFFATNRQDIHEDILEKSLCFISNNHIANTAMLGITLNRMEKNWEKYTKRIISNNNYFFKRLKEIGASFILPENKTPENHQLFWHFENKNPMEVYTALSSLGIYINLLPLPFQEKQILGFRSGIQEFSFLGGEKNDIDILVDIIKQVLSGSFDTALLQEKVSTLKQSLLLKFSHLYD